MKIKNPVLFFWAGAWLLALSACGAAPGSSQATRVATQTPWIIYLPVTSTPELATATALPTITPEGGAKITPTRGASPTRVAVTRPTATKPLTAVPTTAGPSQTTAPACSYSPPVVTEPDERASITTFETHPGSGAFIFKWIPPPNIGGSDIAYKIQMDSKGPTGKPVNGVTVYIPHTKFISDSGGQKFVFDAQHVWYMKQGSDNATVFYYIAVVKFTGTINDSGDLSGTAVECTGSRTPIRAIVVNVQ